MSLSVFYRASRWRWGACLFGVVFGIGSPVFGGRLERVGDTARRSGSSSVGGARSTSSSSDVRRSEGPAGELVILFVYYTLGAPISYPRLAADLANADNQLHWGRRPFEDGCGLMCLRRPNGEPRPGALWLGLEGGADLAGIPLLALEARLLSPWPIELSTRLSGYREQTDAGVDFAMMGKSHLSWRLAEMSHVQFRLGLGPRYWTDETGTEVGLDVLYGVDIQWSRPVSTELEFGVGALGNAFVGQLRGTVGCWVDRYQLFAGWDQSWVGGVPLGGPLGGVRAFF